MSRIIVIVGPTGVGKTKLSVELAKHFNTEIINGDSVQIYKELNIGSAKVTKEEMQGIKHHLLDFKEIEEDYTVYDYQTDLRSKIKEFEDKGLTPIVAGGTGLYLKAALYDYKFEKEEASNFNDYKEYSNEEVYEMLKEKDESLTGEDVKEGLTMIVSCKHPDKSSEDGYIGKDHNDDVAAPSAELQAELVAWVEEMVAAGV